MVRCKYDQCTVRDAGIFQTLQKILHSILQLQLAGNIGLGSIGIGQVGYFVLVSYGHGITAEIVFHVTADGHIVGHKWFIGSILVKALVDQADIGLRPQCLAAAFTDLRIIAVTGTVPFIAHVREGKVTSVVGGGVVVPAGRMVAEAGGLTACGEKHIDLTVAGFLQ